MAASAILSEDATSFTVLGPDGQPMVVAKAGLTNPDTFRGSVFPATVAPDPMPSHFQFAGQQPTVGTAPDPAALAAHAPPAPETPPTTIPSHIPGAVTGPSHTPGAGLPQPGQAQPVPFQAGGMQLGMPSFASGFGMMDRGIQQQQDAARQMGEAEAQKATALADVHAQAVQMIADSRARTEAVIKAHESEINKQEADIRNGHIDPKRFWNRKTDGEKGMAMLGLVISGIGAGMSGQQNAALAMLNKQIDMDVDAQKQDMDKKQNLLGTLYRKYGNAMDAENALRQSMLLGLEVKAKEMGAKADSVEAKARAQALAGQLAVQRGQLAQDFASRMYQMQMMQMMMGAAQQPVGGNREYIPTRISRPGSTANPMEPGKLGEAREKQRGDTEAVTVDLPGGKAVATRKPQDADTIKLAATAYDKFISAANQLEKMNPATPGYDQLLNTVAIEYAKTLNPGQQITEGELKKTRDDIPGFLRSGRFSAMKSAAHSALGETFRTLADLEPKQFGQVYPSPVLPSGFTAMAKVH